MSTKQLASSVGLTASAVKTFLYRMRQRYGELLRNEVAKTLTDPNDVDVLLVLSDDFQLDEADEATRLLLDHMRAAEAFGASIFWLRPSMLIQETLEDFIAHWQIKRDRARRGIVEVRV